MSQDNSPITNIPSDCLDGEALGRLLLLGNPNRDGSAARAIRNRIERGHPLPPAINLPGHRGRLWLRQTVLQWLEAYEAPLKKKKRGRPRKVDALAMQKRRE